MLKTGDYIRYKESVSDDWKHGTVLGSAGKTTGKHKHWYNIQNDDQIDHSIKTDKLAIIEKETEIAEINYVIYEVFDNHVEFNECPDAKILEKV